MANKAQEELGKFSLDAHPYNFKSSQNLFQIVGSVWPHKVSPKRLLRTSTFKRWIQLF